MNQGLSDSSSPGLSPISILGEMESVTDSRMQDEDWEDQENQPCVLSGGPVKPATRHLREVSVNIVRLRDVEIRNRHRPTKHGRAALTKLPGGKREWAEKKDRKPGQLLDDAEKHNRRGPYSRYIKAEPKSEAELERLHERAKRPGGSGTTKMKTAKGS